MNKFNLKYYDFTVRLSHFSRKEDFEYIQCKLPSKDVRSAIKLFICLMDPPLEFTTPEIFGGRYFNIGEAESVCYLFKQVIEFDLKQTRGKTVHQFKQTNTYNRHDFLGLFDRVYSINI